MNVRYCPHCAAKNEYISAKPKFCGSCGKEFDRAFATVKPPEPVIDQPDDQEVQPQTARATRTFKDARGRDVSHIYNRQPVAPQHQTNDEDYVDKRAMYELANQLAASISESDFGISIQEPDNSVKLGSILGPALAAQQNQGKKKRSRKS